MIKSQIPPVISHSASAEEAQWQFVVPADYPAFEGHFDGHPILPGVVQLDWAIQLGAQHFGYTAAVAQVEVLKFQQLIQPDTKVTLTVQHLASKRKLQFHFSDDTHRYATGRLAFAEDIS